jgi:hypothetical protein
MSQDNNTPQSDDEQPAKPQEETEAPERQADTPASEVAGRNGEPGEGDSPEQPPREAPPDSDDVDVAPEQPWRQVPNLSGHGGLPWEELRKGTPPVQGQTAEQRLWDDRGVSKPQQIDYPKKTWDELPEEVDPPEEKITTS